MDHMFNVRNSNICDRLKDTITVSNDIGLDVEIFAIGVCIGVNFDIEYNV